VSRWPVVLFDLDGTITDPKVGITSAVQHALATLGIVVDDPDTLTPYIGPPLEDGFRDHHGVPAPDIAAAIAAYRSYYLDRGIFELVVIEGMIELIEQLARRGRRIALATAKPDVMAEQILDHLALRSSFAVVGGSTLDRARVTKHEVIEHTLAELGIGSDAERAEVVIVGDREHDVLGGRAARIGSIGVRWGYAEPGELEGVAPDAIVATVADLAALLD